MKKYLRRLACIRAGRRKFFQSGDEDVNSGASGAALHRPVHCSTVTRSRGLNPGREGRLAAPE